MEQLKTFQIWCEGYAATGERATAQLLGEEVSNTFLEACIAWFDRHPAMRSDFDPDHKPPTYWACRLYDNERQARKMFG